MMFRIIMIDRMVYSIAFNPEHPTILPILIPIYYPPFLFVPDHFHPSQPMGR